MSQDPSQPAASPPAFVIPEWFQEEEGHDLPAGEPVALPDIFDNLSAVREPAEPFAQYQSSLPLPNPPPTGGREQASRHPVPPKPSLGARGLNEHDRQRLFEIASALGFMAGSLRTWDHDGAEGAAHLLAGLAAELAGIAATGDRA